MQGYGEVCRSPDDSLLQFSSTCLLMLLFGLDNSRFILSNQRTFGAPMRYLILLALISGSLREQVHWVMQRPRNIIGFLLRSIIKLPDLLLLLHT